MPACHAEDTSSILVSTVKDPNSNTLMVKFFACLTKKEKVQVLQINGSSLLRWSSRASWSKALYKGNAEQPRVADKEFLPRNIWLLIWFFRFSKSSKSGYSWKTGGQEGTGCPDHTKKYGEVVNIVTTPVTMCRLAVSEVCVIKTKTLYPEPPSGSVGLT